MPTPSKTSSAFYLPCSTRWEYCAPRRISWRKTRKGSLACGRSVSLAIIPILLVRIRDGESPLLSEALQAFTYWRNRHVTVNLVILNDQDTGYALDLHNTIQRQIVRMGADDWLNQRDGIFVLRTDQLQPADKILFETVAGVILDERAGRWLNTPCV